jgi:hypothetical protein
MNGKKSLPKSLALPLNPFYLAAPKKVSLILSWRDSRTWRTFATSSIPFSTGFLTKCLKPLLRHGSGKTDRERLKHALENPDDVIALAQEQIRDGQRSEEELIPLTSLPPGAAHLAAALRYQERQIAKGLCAVCPEPLARNSVRYCERHLRIARLRHKPKNAEGELPGSIEWLYSDGERLFNG